MRVLTFNTWHGLSGSGLLAIGELEPEHRRSLRFQLQDRVLGDLDADLIFLQELNPVASRARFLAQQLACDEVHQVDQGGMKLLGLGIPVNLSSGLAILARKGWELKKVEAVRLSGPPGFSSDWVNIQWAEFRYALIATVSSPKHGRLVLCNLHLHHGLEPVLPLLERLREGELQGVLTRLERERMEQVMAAGQARRSSEIQYLFGRLDPYLSSCDGALIAGDLNSTPGGAAYEAIVARGFRDLHESALPTWDPPKNVENHTFAEGFNYSVPVFGRSEVKALLRAQDLQPRRIDFLFGSGTLLKPTSCRLWANDPVNGMYLSDHFGVVAEWSEVAKP